MSSYAGRDDDTTLAVDHATVALEPQTFGGVAGQPLVLVLRAQVAAASGSVHAIAYQVTVLAHPDLLGPVLTLSRDSRPK